MKTHSNHKFEILDSPLAGINLNIVEQIHKHLKELKRLFRSRHDLNYLNPHLRRDAGIDELELERQKIAASPLIR
ncbi:MAG: hypothetical protein ACR2O3_09425 [Rhizobiaceae bacterium]